MKQIAHIFTKDLRRLWPQVALLLVLLALYAVCDVRSTPQGFEPASRFNAAGSALALVLPIAIWFVAALLVFQEPLAGDGIFWITRPYHWPKLLAAKVLFLLVFLNLPLLVSDCCILAAQGFPVAAVIPQLLLRQVHIALVFLLPALAIAVVSTGIAQFVMFAVGAVLSTVLSTLVFVWLSAPKGVNMGVVVNEVEYWAIVALVSAIILFQYATRATLKARFALFAILLLSAPIAAYSPFRRAPEKTDESAPSAVQVQYDPASQLHAFTSDSAQSGRFFSLKIPLKATDVPAGTLLRGVGRAHLVRSGKQISSGGPSEYGATIELVDGEYVQSQMMDRSAVGLLNENPADLETSFDLELVNDRPKFTMPIAGEEVMVPGVGRCRKVRE